MPLHFQSIRSGSSGNCLRLSTGTTTLLIDAGFPSMKKCRAALADLLPEVDGVLVSHLHGDHIHHYTLRVLEEWGVPVYVPGAEVESLAARHFRERPFDGLPLHAYDGESFAIGEFSIAAFELRHHPGLPTFGFEIRTGENGVERKVTVATDFCDCGGLGPRFQGADFIYVEANHDPELLERNWNPNSLFHLPNESCGHLLRAAFDPHDGAPPPVMLGHLSSDRNDPALAQDTVWSVLDSAGHGDLDLRVAPRGEPSELIAIG
jgi:phosphoribosyl 1,2-cyclic phosphodiesterase